MARTVKIELIVDANGAVRGIKSADGGFRQLNSTVDKTGRKMLDIGQIFNFSLGNLVAGAVQRIITSLDDVLRKSFELGAAVGETNSKFTTVFGDMSARVDDFGERVGRMAGLTSREFRDLSAISGSIFQGMGADIEQTVENTERVIKLAGDFASFHNKNIQDTFAAVRSGITGETEPLKQLGIILREDDVSARALADSGKTVKSSLTEWERVQARLNIIVERAGVVNGDLARTQDSVANTAKRANRDLREMADLAAQGIIPTFSLLLSVFDEMMTALGEGGLEGAISKVAIVLFDITSNALLTGQQLFNLVGFLAKGTGALIGAADAGLTLDDVFKQIQKTISSLFEGIAKAESALNTMAAIQNEIAANVRESLGLDSRRAREAAKHFRLAAEESAKGFFDQKTASDSTRKTIEKHRAELMKLLANLGELPGVSDETKAALAALTQQLDANASGAVKAEGALATATEQVKKLKAQIVDLEGTDQTALVEMERQAARLEARLNTLQALVAVAANPQKVEGAAPFEPEDVLADITADRMKAESKDAFRMIPEAMREEMEAARVAAEEELNNIGVSLGAWAAQLDEDFGAQVDAIRETLGTLAGAFRDFAEIRADEIRDDLRNEQEAIEGSLAGRVAAYVAAGMAQADAEKKARADIASAQEAASERAGKAIEKQFALYKAAAEAESIVATFQAANKALASAPPPFNYFLMGAVILAGLANVAKIRKQNFGGSTGGGGGGGGFSGAGSTLQPQSSTAAGMNAQLPRRARGGKVWAGEPFIAGDNGPEPIFPVVDGMVIPNNIFRNGGDGAGAAAAMRSALDVTVNVLLDHEVTKTDIFELRTRINRVERYMNEGLGE